MHPIVTIIQIYGYLENYRSYRTRSCTDRIYFHMSLKKTPLLKNIVLTPFVSNSWSRNVTSQQKTVWKFSWTIFIKEKHHFRWDMTRNSPTEIVRPIFWQSRLFLISCVFRNVTSWPDTKQVSFQWPKIAKNSFLWHHCLWHHQSSRKAPKCIKNYCLQWVQSFGNFAQVTVPLLDFSTNKSQSVPLGSIFD